jgi:hypothetical protein
MVCVQKSVSNGLFHVLHKQDTFAYNHLGNIHNCHTLESIYHFLLISIEIGSHVFRPSLMHMRLFRYTYPRKSVSILSNSSTPSAIAEEFRG